MNLLKINKNNITSAELDESKELWVDKDIKELPYPFTRYFSQPVEFAEDLTVEDLMNHIKKYSDIIDFCFHSYTNGISVKEYVDLMETEPARKSFVDTIELHWSTSLVNDEYCMFGTLHGIITDEKEMYRVEEAQINSFKMDLTPINEWKHCRIVIDDNIKASTSTEDGHAKTMRLRNRWTLFELLQYFLFEITIYGSVEDQKKEIEDFDVAQKKYDGFRINPDFAQTLNKDELSVFIAEIENQIEYNTELLKEAVDNDDFETAAKLKKEDVDLKNELEKMIKRIKEMENE